MVVQKIYESNDLPEHIKWQVLSFLRIEWPDGFVGENKLRDWISEKENHPVSFVLTENNLLISHVEVVWKELKHAGNTYKTYGLSGMFTYPSFRKQGYGQELVASAKKYIESQDGDIVLFTSCVQGFYEKAGFLRLDKAKVLKGDPNNPETENESVFMLFLSEKGKQGQKDFEEKPIYFGVNTW